jgi:RecB family exonuclease
MSSFLQQVADRILSEETPPENHIVILPTRRAAGALKQIIARRKSGTFWLPHFTTIDEWACTISGMQKAHQLDIHFACYEAYKEVLGPNSSDISAFFSCVDVLVSDFNDLESHCINPHTLFKELRDYTDIEHFSFLNEPLSIKQESYQKFWRALPEIHSKLKQKLIAQNQGYAGLIMEQALKRWPQYATSIKGSRVVVAGLNALSEAEFRLLKQMQDEGLGSVYFDADNWYLQNEINHAGLFIRRTVKRGLGEIILTTAAMHERPLVINQAVALNRIDLTDLAASYLSDLSDDDLNQTIVVLADENLLVPLLNHLPEKIKKVNITMGLSAGNSNFAQWLESLYKLHETATIVKNQPVFLTEYLQHFLNHPFVADMKCKVFEIDPHRTFCDKNEAASACSISWMRALLGHWKGSSDYLDAISLSVELLEAEISKMDQPSLSLQMALECMDALRRIVSRLTYYPEARDLSLSTIASIIASAIKRSQLSITGQPYEGLQIMGLLETRTLGFKHLLVMPVNEGSLPKKALIESFIPFEIRMYHHLPGKKEKESVYAYLFYRLLSHSEYANCLYMLDADDPSGGEKSRYLIQLEYELAKENSRLKIFNSSLKSVISFDNQTLVIEKTPEVLATIREYLRNGLSASGINNYLQCPLEWYYQTVLKLQEPDKDIELDNALFGTIVHGTLEMFFKDLKNHMISADTIDTMLPRVSAFVEAEFKKYEKSRNFDTGINRIHLERAKNMVSGYLKTEKKLIQEGDNVMFIEAEKKLDHSLKISTSSGEVEVAIKGFADRIEERNNVIRIVDFKTGNVNSKDLNLDELSVEAFRKKGKALQLLFYQWLGNKDFPDKKIEPQIISLPKPSDRLLIPSLKIDTGTDRVIFEDVIAEIVEEMLNAEIPIVKNPDYKYSTFEGATHTY